MNKPTIKVFYVFAISSMSLLGCSKNNILELRNTRLNLMDLKNGDIEIDTIESHPKRGIYFVNIITYRAFGRFSTNYAIIKKNHQASDIIYLINTKKKIKLRASKDFISTVNFADNIWGWFYKKDGVLIDTLPNINNILDSIKSIEGNKQYYIAESKGNIFFNLNGKPFKYINYGNVITKYKTKNFDSLDYKLYKLTGDSITVNSNDGNDLAKRENGIFFIPKPGYGVVNMFNKAQIFAALDSVVKLPDIPQILKFKAIQ